jgi:hypothetical protein
MVITLGPELEKALNDVARQRGVAPEVLALEAIRDRLLGPTRLHEGDDEWVRRLRQVAIDCGVSVPDSALSSDGLYE